jgi:hypothetical protein
MDRLFSYLVFLLASFALPDAALADFAGRLIERDAFVKLVAGHDLVLPLFRVSIRIDPSGSISGSAMGWQVTGQWQWQDGLFCRSMDWSGTEIPPNCQMVERLDEGRLRFTSDAGQGMSAVFLLR